MQTKARLVGSLSHTKKRLARTLAPPAVVWANTCNMFDPTSLFGSYRESGFGREGGLHGLAAAAQKAELVKLRFFVGLSVEEAAEVLGVSTPTVKRWWAYAKAWLYQEIAKQAGNQNPPLG